VITDPDGTGPSMLFQILPEPKTAKNRLHVLQDPEGNELCLV
jgi:hypothetical protein